MAVIPKLECIPFPTPRRSVEVATGTELIVWEERMTGNFVGFIDRISVSRGDDLLGCANTWVDFIVDGVLIERIQREISLNLPDVFHPEIVVRRIVTFRAHNGDISDHEFEVVVQGRLCKHWKP